MLAQVSKHVFQKFTYFKNGLGVTRKSTSKQQLKFSCWMEMQQNLKTAKQENRNFKRTF